MDPKNKFATETVIKLQQSLDDVPPYQANELSKQQTIRTLSPQILALRSKGYSWTAIAAMLSERGVPVSVAALRTYLRRVREEAAEEKPRAQLKRSRDARADTAQTGHRSLATPRPAPSHHGETGAASKLPQPAPASTAAVGVPRVQAPPPRPRQEPSRPMFEVRPDTEDL
jgi:hypothetical protein